MSFRRLNRQIVANSATSTGRPRIETGLVTIPATYDSATGIVVDLSARFSSIHLMQVVATQLPNGLTLITTSVPDSPSNGKATIRISRSRYDKPSNAAAPLTSLPSGVSEATTVSDVDITLDAATNGTAGVSTNSFQNHVHRMSKAYRHGHDFTFNATDATLIELANGTSLAGIALRYLAIGATP
jgi:hypothetical protein